MATTSTGLGRPRPGSRAARKDSQAHILNVAERLFLVEGIRATGVDTISTEARTAKTTLYRHFATKDDLITAYLANRDAVHFDWLNEATAAHEGDFSAQLHAVVDIVGAVVTTPGFAGCPFLNAASEFGDPQHPARVGAALHKRRVVVYFENLATLAGAHDAQALARSLALLTDGAYEAGRVLGPTGPAAAYTSTAHRLVDEALPART